MEPYAICQALKAFELRSETSRQYRANFDSMAAISRATTDGTGPWQRFVVATIEACERTQQSRSEVTTRCAPV